jgi:homoserine kinase type II
MGVFTHVSEAEARALLEHYDVGGLREIQGIPAGSVNSNYALETARGRFFLRVYEEQDEAGARSEAALLAHLAARGVKTPAPLARTDGAKLSHHAGKPVALFPWIEGGMRCQASVTEEDAARVGAELARVHVAGQGVEAGEGRFNYEDLIVRIERIAKASQPDLAAQASALEEHLRVWMDRRAALPVGLIHGDLFRDNVLWSKSGEVTALLDFESASRGILAYDIMVTVLAWCFGDGFDAHLARALVGGYRSVREIEDREKAGLLAEGCLASMRFTVTRITDYAMKAGIGPRVLKDWRRFAMRFDTLESLGEPGLRKALGF